MLHGLRTVAGRDRHAESRRAQRRDERGRAVAQTVAEAQHREPARLVGERDRRLSSGDGGVRQRCAAVRGDPRGAAEPVAPARDRPLDAAAGNRCDVVRDARRRGVAGQRACDRMRRAPLQRGGERQAFLRVAAGEGDGAEQAHVAGRERSRLVENDVRDAR